MMTLPAHECRAAVARALAEDLTGYGDVTSLACVPADATVRAAISAREAALVCGHDLVEEALRQVDPLLVYQRSTKEGERAEKGTIIGRISGPARSAFTAERVALNFMQRMMGVATCTAQFVDAVSGTGAAIAATRKTTPGLRALEKYAVRIGGGQAHRYSLADAILIKDNHIAAAGGLTAALRGARAHVDHMMKISVEVDTLDQLDEALPLEPDVILLDNFSLDGLRAAVARIAGRARIEASGGVTLSNVRAIAQTGVDIISVGALTHSARAVDIGLDYQSA
jgi:nicotinate-nucleotide pyrophosphorylase (carboxylating)